MSNFRFPSPARRSFVSLACLCMAFVLVLALMPIPAKRANAACASCSVGVSTQETAQWLIGSGATYWRITNHVRSEMTGEKVWMISIFWEDNLLPAMMMMADQLTATAMQQMQIVGSFLDAKHQLETQQLIQEIAARTHKDYHPSVGLCEFGSGAKSLAASERKAEMNAVILSQRSQDRQLGAVNTAAARGEDGDKESRIRQFRQKFCDPKDNNNGLSYLCDWNQDGTPGPNTGASNRARMNKDIDYIRTVDAPWTLNVDFISGTGANAAATTLTDNEEEILALASNLYGQNVFVRPSSSVLKSVPGQRISNIQKLYLDMRSVVAKRAVAENSFNAIAAMKSEGTPGSKDYLIALMRELGVSQNEAIQMLGTNPSYYAQMEVLTKKIYHNPDFYTNLYDKPANVERKGVALQAIGLMQKFDLFKSYLRNEASLSILLELAVMDLQEEVENEINTMQGGGTPASP
jgi:hypothetical protein